MFIIQQKINKPDYNENPTYRQGRMVVRLGECVYSSLNQNNQLGTYSTVNWFTSKTNNPI